MYVVTPTPGQLDLEMKIRSQFSKDCNRSKGKRIPFKDMVQGNTLRIRKLMKEQGIKPKLLGAKIGADSNQIQRVLHDQRCEPAILEAIADALSTTLEDIKKDED